MYSRIRKHLKTKKVFHSYQFGSRTNHPTTLALIETLDDVYAKLDRPTDVNDCGIYLDLQKAFDSVFHDICLLNCINMVFEESCMTGLRATYSKGSNTRVC
jgi:hypothetical protein